MKGVVFTEFLEMVEQKFGMDMVNGLIENNTLSSGGVYSAVGTYDHAEMVTLVMDLNKRSGIALPDLLKAFGAICFKPSKTGYPQMFENASNGFDFLQSVDQEIHVEVLKLYPDAELPSFRTQMLEENVLQMDYRSDRAMGALAHGLIEACGEHYDENFDIEYQPQTEGRQARSLCHSQKRITCAHCMSEDAYKKAFERERLARKEAERITEAKSRELFALNSALKELNADLEARILERTAELEQAMQRAEANTKAKSEFLSVMSHEMRSPLNVIVGFTELLEQRELDDPEGGYIRNMKFSALQLLNLINDILDLSAIEAGKIAFERTPFDVGYTINRVFNALEQRAIDKGLTWSKSFPDDLPSPLIGDAAKLNQVLINLLDNAIKFTREGGVDLDLSYLKDKSSERKCGLPSKCMTRARAFQKTTSSASSTNSNKKTPRPGDCMAVQGWVWPSPNN